MLSLLVLTINGLSFGLILFLIASGLTLTLGLMRVANLAHCGFAMMAGYLSSFLIKTFDLGLFGALPFAVFGTIVVAVILEKTIFQWVYEATQLQQILLTIGLTFVMVAAANFLFGPTIVTLPQPAFLSGSVQIGDYAISVYRLFLVGVSASIACGLWLFLDHTSFGARLRATIDNRRMAQCVGLDVDSLLTIAFALGCGLAAIGGVLGTSMFPLEPTYAVKYIVIVLVVVATGGLGSLRGSLVAAIGIGCLDTFGRYFVPALGGIGIYVIAACILLLRPQGLFGMAGAR